MTRLAMPGSVACERDLGAGGRRVGRRHQACRRAHFSIANTPLERPRAEYGLRNVLGSALAIDFGHRALRSRAGDCLADAFGPAGAGYIRLSVANSDAMLAKAVERISAFVRKL